MYGVQYNVDSTLAIVHQGNMARYYHGRVCGSTIVFLTEQQKRHTMIKAPCRGVSAFYTRDRSVNCLVYEIH